MRGSRATYLILIVCTFLLLGAQQDCAAPPTEGEDTGLDDKSGSNGSEKKAKPAKTRRFSGNGSKSIGSINVPTSSVLEWTNTGDAGLRQFIAYDKGFQFNVTSEAASGETSLSPGRYEDVQVSGGDWTITVKPR